MIPKATETTPELQALASAIEASGAASFYYPVLSASQFRLHGRLIQLYNSMEFNLRRSTEFLGRAKMLGRYQKNAAKLRASELVPAIVEAVASMDPAIEDIEESKLLLHEIEIERSTRNILAHWVARQIPGHKAIVYLTNDNFDGRQATGANIKDDHIQFAILEIDYLYKLDGALADRDEWLGCKTSEWHARYCA